ncbi:MAG TPA: SHOCT domain-containing protein [Candidatus Dormibacteraeota bacterium]|nr:SHOCT domain-containing protein [Candidatus Dormibacteraeota bacterium]
MSFVGPGMMFGGHLFFLFAFLVFWGAVIAVIVLAVRASTRTAYPTVGPPMHMGATPPPARETPLEILARRFASGEITADEYQKARDLLGGGGKT